MNKRVSDTLGKMALWFSENSHEFLEAPNHNMYLTIPRADSSDSLVCALNCETPSDQVWLGTLHKWVYFYSGKEFRKMAAWALWRWAWGDWFGLRTKLFLYGLKLRYSNAQV
jgi:hypothetical protein